MFFNTEFCNFENIFSYNMEIFSSKEENRNHELRPRKNLQKILLKNLFP